VPPRRSSSSASTSSSSATEEVWRAVWERDGGRCAFPLENGGVCGSTHQLELDHVRGFALGAGTTVDECQILCRGHQDVSARQLYGDELMDRYTRPKGTRCSELVAGWGPRARPATRERCLSSTTAWSGSRGDGPYSAIRYCCSFA
jgi:5-methylcytosine-specific restriction endonuclease McrA